MKCGNDDEPNDPNKRDTLTKGCKEPIVIPLLLLHHLGGPKHLHRKRFTT
jgi:hypothetical protein